MIFKQLFFLHKFLLLPAFIFVFSVQSIASTKNNLLYTGFTVSYDVSKNDFLLGVSERQLLKESTNQYTYKSLTYATGVASWFVKDKVSETSRYQLLKDKIVPSRYDFKNSNGKPKDNFSIIFNNIKNTVTRTKDNIEHDIANNKQDLLSFQVAIMLAMQQKDKIIEFSIADNKKISIYSLTHIQNENLKTSNGEINTQVMKSNSKTNKYRFTFWCAKKYDFLPIIIKRTKENGEVLFMRVNNVNGQKITFNEPSGEDDY